MITDVYPLTQYLKPSINRNLEQLINNSFRLFELVCFISNFGFRVLHMRPVLSIVVFNLNALSHIVLYLEKALSGMSP